MDIYSLIKKSPEELFKTLLSECGHTVPQEIITVEDMQNAATLLARLTNEYSFLLSLLSLSKIECRSLKRSGDKTAYEDMVDKKEIVSNMTDAVKQQYQAISRAVTIKIENNTELRMSEVRG